MIEPTDEMREAFERAFEFATSGDEVVVSRRAIRAGLAAALALVERDNDVTPKTPPVEHRMTDKGVWWNHYMIAFYVSCTCGAEFSDGDLKGAKWRLLDHIDDQDGAP